MFDNNNVATMGAVARTSQGLRDALFDEWDAMRNGQSNPQRASAIAKLAVQIIGTVQMDIEYQKYVATTLGGKPQPLPILNLGKAA